MKPLMALTLAVIACLGLQAAGFAKAPSKACHLKAAPVTKSSKLPSVMEVLASVNTKKTAKASNQNFQQFLNRKEQMNDGIQMLEKATSVREGVTPSNRAPKAIIPKAY